MKKKGIWLVVSSLVVLALLAASCGGEKEKEAAPVVKEEAAPVVKKEAAPVVKEEAAPAVKEAAPAEGAETVKVTLTKVDGTTVERMIEKPQYGGVFTTDVGATILGWDEALQPPWMLSNLGPTNQDLLMGSWYRGPAGTGETNWQPVDWLNLDLVAGDLAESWEFPDDVTIIYHIRKGVKWQNKPPVNGREFTADDVVYNIKRIYFDIKTSTMYGMAGDSRPTDVYATDKYTVVMKASKGMLGKTWEYVSNMAKMVPPEVVAQYGDMNDWENVVGTGAFILTDYVPMSSATYTRNPDYWEYDPVLGKDYPLPYLDTIKTPIIPDTSTRLAALRTGKVDFDANWYSRDDAQPLIKSNPELVYLKNDPILCVPLGFRQDKPELPFDDIRVRRALLMGVNGPEIADTFFSGDAVVLNYKVPPPKGYVDEGWYTPLAELPESTRELYEYHPDKAKQLLAEAGYPDGFRVEAVVTNAAFYPFIDVGSILQEYWRQIGVDFQMDIKEYGTHQSIYQRKTHKEALWWGRACDVTAMYLVRKGNMYNWAMCDDPKIDDYYYPEVSNAYFDREKKNKLMREMNQYVLSQAFYYTPPAPYAYSFAQPWLKNHYFLTGTSVYSAGETYRYYWIDQDLKKSMGH